MRIISDQVRPVVAKAYGTNDAKLEQESRGGPLELTWTANKQRPIQIDDSIPAGFNPYPVLQLSTYGDWASVAAWALPLYTLPDPLPPPVGQKAAELTTNLLDREDKGLAILHFVQEDISEGQIGDDSRLAPNWGMPLDGRC